MKDDHSIRPLSLTLAATAFLLFPPMLLIGFLLHPHVMSFEIVTTADQLIENFRHMPGFHFGHLFVMAAAPLIIFTVVYVQRMLEPTNARIWGDWGSVLGVFGAALLMADKGALTLVLSAFDTLSDEQIEQIRPALQTIVDRDGLLGIFVLLPSLMIGAAMQAFGLWRAKLLRGWQALAIVIGLALLINPDIEVISAIGALLMCLGYTPFAVRLFREGER